MRVIDADAIALQVRRNLMPNVDDCGMVTVEDAERYFLRLLDKAPTVDAVEVSDDDFGAVLNCAVRYAIGRQTYMPSLVVGYITPLIPRLSDKTLWCFNKDIAEQKRLGYGDPMIDEPLWIKFHEAVRTELLKRKDGDGA